MVSMSWPATRPMMRNFPVRWLVSESTGHLVLAFSGLGADEQPVPQR
jgi:hypothetical protein